MKKKKQEEKEGAVEH